MSDRYGTIIVSSNPKGHFEECIIVGTPKPGQCMTILAATEPVNGKFSVEPFNRSADGEQAEIGVLLENELEGSLITTAYVTGTLGRIYYPAMGELLQMLVANIAGTGDAFAIGDMTIVDDGTGKLVATTGSPEMESFRIMETQAALTADLHVLCQFTGS